MKITQLRNATVVLEFGSVVLLVDPMLSRQGALPPLKWLVRSRRRNPLVEMPEGASALLDRVTHVLITHCQRGHFDHLDRAGIQFLRERRLPTLCMPHDAKWLAGRGLDAQVLTPSNFFGGTITPVACTHGLGLVGSLMEHGSGYFIELPGEPTVYLAGDTILTDDLRAGLARMQPAVSVLPAGGARLDLGGDIIMGAAEVCEACALISGIVIANHLEALDHCPTTRLQLETLARESKVAERLRIPRDGESYTFARFSGSTFASSGERAAGSQSPLST